MIDPYRSNVCAACAKAEGREPCFVCKRSLCTSCAEHRRATGRALVEAAQKEEAHAREESIRQAFGTPMDSVVSTALALFFSPRSLVDHLLGEDGRHVDYRSIRKANHVDGDVALVVPCSNDCYPTSKVGDALAHTEMSAVFGCYCSTCGHGQGRPPEQSRHLRGELATHPVAPELAELVAALRAT